MNVGVIIDSSNNADENSAFYTGYSSFDEDETLYKQLLSEIAPKFSLEPTVS